MCDSTVIDMSHGPPRWGSSLPPPERDGRRVKDRHNRTLPPQDSRGRRRPSRHAQPPSTRTVLFCYGCTSYHTHRARVQSFLYRTEQLKELYSWKRRQIGRCSVDGPR